MDRFSVHKLVLALTVSITAGVLVIAYKRRREESDLECDGELRALPSEDDGDYGEEAAAETASLTFGRDARLAQQSSAKRQLASYSKVKSSSDKLINKILHGVIGGDVDIVTVFGVKRSLYCDWTGSAKGLDFVEDYMRDTVLPMYANTHSMENRMGLQTTCFREEAREIIQLACNANRKKDVVVFTGNGATGAIQKLVSVLGIDNATPRDNNTPKCVVFVGPFEHTSNLVIWRETCAKVIMIPEKADGSGCIDQEVLSKLLDHYAEASMKIGSFSACSNVTGVIEDVDAVTVLLHQKGAFAFWDYASAGPYCEIDMNPVSTDADRPFAHKDAVFLSTHKFVGGVGGTGVLVAKRSLFNNRVPHACGGGTVYFVDHDGHRFLSDIASREEGGTPNILGAIRAGLAFKVKQSVGVAEIRRREDEILRKAAAAFATVKDNLVLFGPAGMGDANERLERLPTFSFLIRKGGRYLHHNFVVALLSDLYGIQCRGGCLCAGPYVQTLLGMTLEDVHKLEAELIGATHQREQFRPGVTRISIPYFFDEERVDYVLRAICDVARFGWRLLPLYRYENMAGEWGHRSRFQKFPQRVWLADFLDQHDGASVATRTVQSKLDFAAQADEAMRTMQNPPDEAFRVEGATDDDDAYFRWFLLPSEASSELRNVPPLAPNAIIVQPDRYLDLLRAQVQNALQPEPFHAGEGPVDGSTAVCAIRPSSSKRDAKQPRRTAVREIDALAERELAFLETVEKHLSITAQMSEAAQFPEIPHKIMKLVVQASKEWGMINPGDRLLLGLSGGKDSLCLLHVLLQIQKRAPFKFEIACCTVEPGAGEAFDPAPLIPYVKSLGLEYHFEKTDIFESARETLPNAASYCSFCARMKRGTLYRVAKEHGYTALVLAQHLDDFVESFFMSAIRNGCLRTMKANYVEQKGEVRVIRPLCYVRERDTKEFSYAAKLPVINENCPACFSAPTERERVKRFLKDQERLVPTFFESVRKAILPLMDGNTYSALQAVEDRLKSSKNANLATKDAKSYGQKIKSSKQRVVAESTIADEDFEM